MRFLPALLSALFIISTTAYTLAAHCVFDGLDYWDLSDPQVTFTNEVPVHIYVKTTLVVNDSKGKYNDDVNGVMFILIGAADKYVAYKNEEHCDGGVTHTTKHNVKDWSRRKAPCDPADYETVTARYPYAHMHKAFDFSIVAYKDYVDSNSPSPPAMPTILRTPRTVTATLNRDHWESTRFDMMVYTASDSENPKVNCWGWAFGVNTWVLDPAYIYDWDYTAVPNGNAKVAGDIINQASEGHAIKVVEVYGASYGANAGNIKKTSEKVNESRIYSRTYAPADDPFDGVAIRRPIVP